jgi:hypothetical protein
MIRWTPKTPATTPQRWQSREEILKAHLDSLTPSELFSGATRPHRYALRFGSASYARKYDANQPRVPAGNPDVGQWSSDGELSSEQSAESADSPTDFSAARRRRGVEAECDAQYKRDTVICNLVKTPLCWKQTMARYAAFLGGHPIPELRF